MAKLISYISNSCEETLQFGKKLAEKLKKGSIVAFFAPLGAGKTTLIKGLVQSLNAKIQVNSPTFIYMNIYEASLPIYHFDVYRLKNEEDFLNMGFEEYFSSDGICLIEWAENIEQILPKNILKVYISHLSENQREIKIYES